MNHPIHSVQYVKKKYKKYQLFTTIFATITILTAIVALISGLKISRMQSQLEQATVKTETKLDNKGDLDNQIAELKAQLVKSNQQLSAQKQQSSKLTKKVGALEAELKEMRRNKSKVAVPSPSQTPVKPDTSDENHIEAKPNPDFEIETNEDTQPVEPQGEVTKTPPTPEVTTDKMDSMATEQVSEPEKTDPSKMDEGEPQTGQPEDTSQSPAPTTDPQNPIEPVTDNYHSSTIS